MKRLALLTVLTLLKLSIAQCETVAEEPSPTASQSESRYVARYPQAASKKGLQVAMVDDALALGIKHAAINIDLARVIAPGDTSASDFQWTSQGREFHFRRRYVEQLDRQIKPLSDHGVIVNLIVLAYASGNADIDRILLHPNYDPKAPNRLGAFNSETDEGKAWLIATLEFLAERWSQPDEEYGRVCGYIIGNEVNSHWWWANMGHVSLDEFTRSYQQVVRWMHGAIRRQSSWARVYISLEHHWNIRYPAGSATQAFAGRPFLEAFARQVRAAPQGDFDWHLAFHPYPEDLFDAKFWEDESATDTDETPRITFKNIERLTEYLAQPHLLYEGQPRRIILSEQGFHSDGTEEGELIQAAAYCLAYRKVDSIDGIDAFILHRHVDHPREGGLNLGLRRYLKDSPERPKKPIWDCFQKADTDQWQAAFEFALPIVGKETW